MQKFKYIALAALFLAIALPSGASAAVDRAIIEIASLPAGTTTVTLPVHYMDDLTEVQIASVEVPIAGLFTQVQYATAIEQAIQNYAVGQGYTLTKGIVWPFVPDPVISYHNGFRQPGMQHITFSGTISSGQKVFYLTDDGTVNGNALCLNGIRHTTVNVNDPANTFGLGWTITNSDKTLTITVKSRTFATVSLLGVQVVVSTSLVNAADGTAVSASIDCN